MLASSLPRPSSSSLSKGAMRTIVLLATIVALSANAEIFKWIDERGQTQYGESPPPGVKATKVAVPPPQDNATQDSAEKWKQQDLDFRKRQGEREQRERTERARDEERRRVADQNDKARASRCIHYKEQLTMVEGRGNVSTTNEKGETVLLTDFRRDEAKEKLRKLVKEHC